jgi:hypothetical protein
MLALLYFDDVIDDYRDNLKKVFQTFKNQHILTILLDVSGMGAAIETPSIYREFFGCLNKTIKVQQLTI